MMPATSEKQRRLMADALHGATFPKAKKLRRSMTTDQLRDFSKTTATGESHAYNWRSRHHLKRGR